MAVNIVEIGSVYDALETKISETLTSQYDMGRLKGAEYADVLAASMAALINASVQTVQQQPLTDAQVEQAAAQTNLIITETGIKEVQSAKDLLLKDAQVLDMKVKDYATLANTQKDIELKDAQVLTEQQRRASMVIEDGVKQAQSEADLDTKGAQKLLIENQTSTEAEKALLTTRQKDFYDDQKELKVMEAAGNAIGMYAAGSGTVPEKLQDEFIAYMAQQLPTTP